MRIRVEGLSKSIQKNLVLNNVSATFESGKIYGFSGRNGSGKTMLMRAICGLILPTEGDIFFDEEKMHQDFSFPKSVGALIENPGFISNYTGFKNLQIIAKIKNIANDEDIEKALECVGLDSKDKKTFKKYSLGMKQKLGIACAIMENPELLVLDEPFNALDEDSVENIKKIILLQKQRGAIVLLSCHDKEDLLSLADEIYYFKNGTVTNKEECPNEA